MRNNVRATGFAGQELARLMTWGTGTTRRADYEAASPCRMCNTPQHVLEPVVLEAAQGAGAGIRFPTDLVDVVQDEDGGSRHGTRAHHRLLVRHRARYVIGADGGRSTVAQKFGFPFDGQTGLGTAVNVWLEADLTRHTVHRPGVLY
ncbi:2,4-dichlorophenol 6-monooxygenase [Streptomyces sp. enrichment culture]|uniref:FAD-dependent monooxygenase n=1 Tax=Streptomyces sp. enrichment culture TaxID=1795815 RepID=UPI003F5789EC